ncbi:MAG: Ig-like domain-containing protein, partial [Lachnospiraceae bacterium]|nr:Ig-like domain-containing protein [Lachnospiraceae bacterium]
LRTKSMTLKINKTKKLKLKRTKLKYVEWESSNDQIAYVDPGNGRVYALKSGRVTLRTRAGGVTNSCSVLVQDPGQVTKGPALSK